jgi:type I restriction enzyme S subunit
MLVTKDYIDTVYSGFLIRFRLSFNLELLFKRYCFSISSFRKELLSLATSSANTNINQESLEKIPVFFPCPSEQIKIADFLSEVDKKIDFLFNKKQRLKSYKKGIMDKVFNQEIRFKDDDGNSYPDWIERKLDELAKISTGNKDTQNKIEDGDFPFFVRSQTVENINSYSYDGEAILTSGDGVGVGKNFHYIIGKFDYHQRVYCINEFKKGVLGKFVFYYFSKHFYERVIRLSAKNSVDSIRREMITKMVFKMPSIEEQKKIAYCVAEFDTKINQVTCQLDEIKQFKTGLIQQMFV